MTKGARASSGLPSDAELIAAGARRVERIGDAVLILGDCRAIAPTLPDVDVVLTDPPYGVGVDYGCFEDTLENVEALAREWLPIAQEKARRVCFTPGIWGMWCYPRPSWVINWQEAGGTGSGPWGFATWQPILCYGPDPFLAAGKGRRPDTIKGRTNRWEEQFEHPCPKPQEVWREVLARVSVEGAVADYFMGSGTTGVVATQFARPFYGIELDPAHFDTACRRVAEAARQPSLFHEPAQPKAEQLALGYPVEQMS